MIRSLIALLLVPGAALAVPVKPDPRSAGRMEATWSGHTVVLYTAGSDAGAIGVWDRSMQIRIAAPQTRKILDAFERAKFDAMPGSFGGLPKPAGGRALGRPERLIGSVTRTVNGKTHSVVQLQGGAQSEELAALAKEILDVCAEAAKTGVTARDLKDGLQKIQKKVLEPEMVHLMVHRLSERLDDANGEYYLMRVEGRTVTTQQRTAKGYATPVKLELTAKELADLLQTIIDADPASWPVNLWAPTYTDFVVGVLGHEKNLQARQFAGMTPQTHGDKQKAFERAYEAMVQLHRRALKEGKETPPPK
jgi:hypothetical protein